MGNEEEVSRNSFSFVFTNLLIVLAVNDKCKVDLLVRKLLIFIKNMNFLKIYVKTKF